MSKCAEVGKGERGNKSTIYCCVEEWRLLAAEDWRETPSGRTGENRLKYRRFRLIPERNFEKYS
jgi:hypothetical protein